MSSPARQPPSRRPRHHRWGQLERYAELARRRPGKRAYLLHRQQCRECQPRAFAYDFINNTHILIDSDLTNNGTGLSITVGDRGVGSGAATFTTARYISALKTSTPAAMTKYGASPSAVTAAPSPQPRRLEQQSPVRMTGATSQSIRRTTICSASMAPPPPSRATTSRPVQSSAHSPTPPARRWCRVVATSMEIPTS